MATSKAPPIHIYTTTEALAHGMETLGVSCWDFAYANGKCCLTAGKNCFRSKSQPRKLRAELKSEEQERFIADTFAPITVSEDEIVDAPNSHSHSHRKMKSGRGLAPADTRTYLLSSPTPSSICYPHTCTTISTLLMTPHTQLILLVPQSHILCPKVCEFSRLPRAGGSGLQVLPVAPPCSMACNGSGETEAERKLVEEIVKKVYKYTKARAFDGYLAFEDNRANWVFLEHVGKGLKSVAKKER